MPEPNDSGFGRIRDEMRQRQRKRESYAQNLPLNACLLIVAVVLFIAWFYFHIHHSLRTTLVVGTSLTIWTVWRMVQNWLPERLAVSQQSIIDRLLAHQLARTYLCLGLVVAVILLLTTSSIHIEHPGGPKPYTVELWKVEPGTPEPFAEAITVNSVDKIRGGPHFMRLDWLWSPATVEVRVVQPFGLIPKSFQLRPWTQCYVELESFDKAVYSAVRLIPHDPDLLALPLAIRNDNKSPYFVKLEINGKEVKTCLDMMTETIYFGDSSMAIQGLFDAEPVDNRQLLIYGSLAELGGAGMTEERKWTLARVLTTSCRMETVEGIVAGAKVRVKLCSNSADGVQDHWQSREEVIPEGGGITTIYVEL